MDKEDVVNIYTTEYYSVIKKEGNPAIYNNKDGPWKHYSKWNKSDKDKYYM